MNAREEFVAQLDAALVRRGMNRASLARAIGKSRSYVTAALKGNMTVRTMVELASAAGMELHVQIAKKPQTFADYTCLYLDPAYHLAA